MNIEELISAITPEQYHSLRCAVETGKWKNGRQLSCEEKEDALQLLIAYDIRFLSPEDRIGYIPPPPPAKSACDHPHEHSDPDLIHKQH